MTVVNLQDYRPPKYEGGACNITFIGFPFRTPEGAQSSLTCTIHLQKGDEFMQVIEDVKAQGGLYLPSQDGGKTFWFAPWPFAAIRVCPMFSETAGTP
jgi:hypothetical protein